MNWHYVKTMSPITLATKFTTNHVFATFIAYLSIIVGPVVHLIMNWLSIMQSGTSRILGSKSFVLHLIWNAGIFFESEQKKILGEPVLLRLKRSRFMFVPTNMPITYRCCLMRAKMNEEQGTWRVASKRHGENTDFSKNAHKMTIDTIFWSADKTVRVCVCVCAFVSAHIRVRRSLYA